MYHIRIRLRHTHTHTRADTLREFHKFFLYTRSHPHLDMQPIFIQHFPFRRILSFFSCIFHFSFFARLLLLLLFSSHFCAGCMCLWFATLLFYVIFRLEFNSTFMWWCTCFGSHEKEMEKQKMWWEHTHSTRNIFYIVIALCIRGAISESILSKNISRSGSERWKLPFCCFAS